jgi:hypothetical protein
LQYYRLGSVGASIAVAGALILLLRFLAGWRTAAQGDDIGL